MVYDESSMSTIFSNESRQYLWRLLWSALAEGQSIQGLPHTTITAEQVKELYDVCEQPIDLSNNSIDAHKEEFESRCKLSKDIVGIGADRTYVEDNANVLLMRFGHEAIVEKINYLIVQLAVLAEKNCSAKCICHVDNTNAINVTTTTVGKRICAWINDLDLAHDQVCMAHDQLAMVGFKADVGNQTAASALFGGDRTKADALDKFVCDKFGMDTMMIANKTYSRIYDSTTANAISLVAQALSNLAHNLHVLHLAGEMRVNVELCGTIYDDAARVLSLQQRVSTVTAVQWMDDTIDVAAIRGTVIPEMFIHTYDCIINMITVIEGIEIDQAKCIENLLHRQYRVDTSKYDAVVAPDGVIGFAREQTMDYLEAIYNKYDPD